MKKVTLLGLDAPVVWSAVLAFVQDSTLARLPGVWILESEIVADSSRNIPPRPSVLHGTNTLTVTATAGELRFESEVCQPADGTSLGEVHHVGGELGRSSFRYHVSPSRNCRLTDCGMQLTGVAACCEW
jgi:hypothetical protein